MQFDGTLSDQDGAALVDRLDAALGEQNSDPLPNGSPLGYGAPVIRVSTTGIAVAWWRVAG